MAECPDCGQDFQRLDVHMRSHTGAVAVAEREESEEERTPLTRGRKADEASATSWRVTRVGPATLPSSVRDPQSPTFNVTHAWYFYPPTADVEGICTTGLPMDVFHSSSTWQPHQRQMQEDQDSLLVMPIERYGGTVAGSPYVHLLPPTDETWERIVDLWRQVIPQEIAIEQDLLEQAEADLERMQSDRGERLMVRNRVQVLSRRVKQLETLDFDRVRRFFEQEHVYSRTTGRTSAQQQQDLIGDLITEEFERRAG